MGATTFSRLTRRFSLLVAGAVIGASTYVMAAGATPGASGSLDQCGNGSDGTATCTVAGDWVPGNLGKSKASYTEGDSLPYRLVISGLTAATSNTVTIKWDTTKSGKHALDYLTTFNRTVAAANPCVEVTGCGSPTTFAIPVDGNVTGAGVTPIAGNFTMYNGTITGASSYTRTGTYADNSETQITLTFTPSSATSVLAWGGHISTRLDWGQGNSAVGISGSPYHTSLVEVNGGGGSQDRSASADAVVFPGSITIVKDTQPNDTTDFAFSSTGGLTPATFSLDDDSDASLSNTRSFTNITTFETYTITEAATSGWTLSFPTPCSVTSANGGSQSVNAGTRTVTIDLEEGENVACTFVNSRQAPKLTVITHVVNDNGGSKAAGDFQIAVTGDNASPTSFAGAEAPGTPVALDPGTYSVAGGDDSGYTKTVSGDCAGSISAGGNKTCTITYDDKPASLTVIKKVVNDNGGTLASNNFTITVTGDNVSSASFPGADSPGTTVTLDAGDYSVDEDGDPGYAGNLSDDCAGIIGNGDSRICTITNDDRPATLTVTKVVVNDDGRTATVADFPLFVGSTSVTSGVPATFNAGTYTVSEDNLPGYVGTFSGACAGGTVTLTIGQTAACTITNDDLPIPPVPGHIVAEVQTLPLPSGQTFGFTADYDDDGFSLADDGSNDSGPLVADTYAVSQEPVAGWTTTVECTDGSDPDAIDLAAGETVTCVFTNTRIPAVDPPVIPADNGGGDPSDPATETEGATQTQGGNPTNTPVEVATDSVPPADVPKAIVPATIAQTSPTAADELPRTGTNGLREETLLGLLLMLAGLLARGVSRRTRPSDI